MPEIWELRQMQSLPLAAKIVKTQMRIREWYDHFDGNVYVSFSGGKDSTVLAHIVHEMYPDVPLVYSDTGLEYPEIRQFARKMGAEIIRPKMRFDEVVSKYGYPIIGKEVSDKIHCARQLTTDGKPHSITYHSRTELLGKRTTEDNQKSRYNKEKWLALAQEGQFMIHKYCCQIMKKNPLHGYQSKTKRFPYIATLTEESQLRTQAWLQHGCNSFNERKKTSQPMSFWLEQDVLKYVRDKGIEIASVYGDIVAVDKKTGFEYDPLPGIECELKCTKCERTGCIFCGYGIQLEKGETRFQRLAKTHPKQYEYCMGGGQWVDNPNYDPTAPEYDGEWKNWNPKKIWTPSKKGLGMKKVFDDCNAIYGKDFIRYE